MALWKKTMKIFKLHVIVLLAFSQTIQMSQAETERVTTPYGYNSGGFCEKGADKLMEQLTKANLDRTNKIEELREQIEKLSKRNAVICEVKAMKDNYERNLVELANPQQNPNPTALLDPLKSTMRNGLMINAISLLLKKNNLDENQTLSMNSICMGEESLKICEMDPIKKTFRHNLTPLLAAFQKAYVKVGEKKDQDILKSDVENIISSIPNDLAPDVILSLIDAKAPELSKILSSDLPRIKIEECLSGSKTANESCKVLVSDPKLVSSLKKVISSETVAFQSSITTGFAPALSGLLKNRQSELEQIFSFSSAVENPISRFKKMATEALKKTQELSVRFKKQEITSTAQQTPSTKPKLADQAVFFYTPPKLNGKIDGEREALEAQAIANANQQSVDFGIDCNFDKPTSNQGTDEEMISKCRKHLDKLKIGYELRQSEYGKRLTALDEEMKSLDANDKYNHIENLKKYLAEKYICECNSQKAEIKKVGKSLVLDIKTCNQSEYLNTIKITSLESLATNLSTILRVEFAKDINTDKNKCSEIASPENLKQYSKSCQGDNLKAFKEICSMVESVKRTARKAEDEERKWEERSKKYWIDTDENGKVKLTQKKSNARVFAEGFLPVAIPALLPNWLYDFKLRSDIKTLTDQGMFNKQLFHSIDIYNQNPWMYDYSNMMLANPFGFNTMNGSSSTSTTGFNFGM